jgi:glutamate dehydrogenase
LAGSGSSVEEAIAAAQARMPPAARGLFAAFARALLREVGSAHGVGVKALAGVAAEVFEFARVRKAEEIRLRARNPEGRPGRTVIEVAQADRSFIVDSVRLLLRRRGLQERVFLHPILRLRRDADGELAGVQDPTSEAAEAGASPESVLYAEVAPRVEEGGLPALEAALREVLEQVREVTRDYPRLVRAVRELGANLEFAGRFVQGGSARAAKICRFLDWLVEGHFVFAGLRRYALRPAPVAGGEPRLALMRGSGLGLWRDDASSWFAEERLRSELPADLAAFLDDPRIIAIDKSRLESRLHRPGRLDRVLVKEHDEAGRVTGFAILFGLFTQRALRTPGSQIPLLAERLESILAGEVAPPGSHRYKAIVAAFDSAPVEFLLGSDVPGIAAVIREVVETEGSKRAALVLSRDRSGRSFYAAVLLPREGYREDLRSRLRRFLEERTGATYIDDRVSFLEERTAALHFFCTTSARGGLELPPDEELEREIQALCARWEDRLVDALLERHGEVRGHELAARWEMAFPEALRVRTDPLDAVRDIEALEALAATGEPQFAFYFGRGDESRETATLKLFLREAPLLSELLPVVDHFGLRVVDAQEARVTPHGRPAAVVKSLRVLPLGAEQEDLDAVFPRLARGISAVLARQVADDELNGLVLAAGLDWRQVDVLRAYLEYFLQLQIPLTRPFLRAVLLQNPLAVRQLVRLFEARLDPALPAGERAAREERERTAFEGYRDRIPSLNEDRALNGLRALIEATLRTSFFAAQRRPHRVAFKIDPAALPELRPPRPWREIFVHSQQLMGIHLRGGPVARGGIRFSDRFDDLRVEILGLMRTQTIKNGLIVPVGAKGGFVLKQAGVPSSELRALADAQYRIFVESLLDLTDNLSPEGRVIPPGGVHRRDGDDPYLVVAADKGTAHLSDAANEVARAADFWLGDAFASGGSEGYDHKRYGITARGAFECVKHHFSELGIDPERDSFSVAGIGDMSGDVFGNGLLLMRRARLLAAFDHRHVFLDPDPDPERAFQERRRLFALPRSSWADYDPNAISAGGGVFPRDAKRIALSARARELLGVASARPSGPEVVRAILALPVDLLWNGGIGTYVKASAESHADVGDRSNDPVRIDATELRARVVGEGGNLGLTQAARSEAALRGVRLDADSIHNSGGVDLSDHEVNYKILLAPLVRSGRLGPAERHAALFEVDELACQDVLAHNRSQSLAISLDERRSREDPVPFLRAIELCCRAQQLGPDELGLPDAAALEERRSRPEPVGLTRPELAVLLGLAKLEARRALSGSPLLADPFLAPLFAGYFPERYRRDFAEAVAAHRLRPEITAMVLANRLLDAGGAALLTSLATELEAGVPEVAAAVLEAEEVLEAPRLRAELLALAPTTLRGAGLYDALLELDASVRTTARALVQSRSAGLDAVRLERRRAALAELRARLADFLTPGGLAALEQRRDRLAARGLPPELAAHLATAPICDRALSVVRLAESGRATLLDAARAYARIGEATGIDWVHRRLADARPGDLWDRLLLVDARAHLLELQHALTDAALAARPGEPLAGVEAFLAANAAALERVRALQERAVASGSASALAVLTQRLRALRGPSEAA